MIYDTFPAKQIVDLFPHKRKELMHTDKIIEILDEMLDYRNLIVRVSGFSAYFIKLEKGLQDEIIKRMEQSF